MGNGGKILRKIGGSAGKRMGKRRENEGNMVDGGGFHADLVGFSGVKSGFEWRLN